MKTTVCPRNCYSSCSFRVEVKNNKVQHIFPHEGNRATPEGVCLKGLSYIERANSKDRIVHPLLKNKNGEFERISWDKALDLLATKLGYLKQTYGSQSILFYAASGMSGLLNEISSHFWRIFGGATTTYGNLCWPAGLEATRLTLGENKHNTPWDIENAHLIIIWGKNPVETNVQQIIFLQKAIDKGAKVVLIDPRKSPTAAYAHYFYRIKHGTDAALALALSHLLIKNNQIDSKFIDEYVLGFDEFTIQTDKYTPEWAAEITGLSVSQIIELAELIGSIKPMTIIPGYGMQRYSNGGQSIRSILSLQILTGNIGNKGATWHYANLQSYVFDAVKEPEAYYPPKVPDKVFRRSVSMARLGRNILAQQNPPLKMIWVERGNPLAQNPETPKVLEAFRKMEFRVVVEQFITDTALEADLILPAKNMFEQSDLVGGYWNPYVQLRQKVVEAPPEVKPETEIYYLLAKKLQIKQPLIDEYLVAPEDEAIERWLKNKLKAFPELSWDKLKKAPQLAHSYEEIAFADKKFNTPSGKIELFSMQAKELWGVSCLPDYIPISEFQNNEKYPLVLMSPNTKNRIHSQFGNLPAMKMLSPEPSAYISPATARKYGIENGHMIDIYNDRGRIRIAAKLDNSMPENAVLVHNGWQQLNGCTPNMLSAARETDMGHGTAFHDNRVAVKIS